MTPSCPRCHLHRKHANADQCIFALVGELARLRKLSAERYRRLHAFENLELSASETLERLVIQGRVAPIEIRGENKCHGT